jgi:hypothetical protein
MNASENKIIIVYTQKVPYHITQKRQSLKGKTNATVQGNIP